MPAWGGHSVVEDTEPSPNSFSQLKHIRKHCLFNILPHIKTLQTVGRQEKSNSLHFPETENRTDMGSIPD